MKRLVALVLMIILVLMLPEIVLTEGIESNDWTSAPAITKAYEQSFGQIYVEWSGNAPVYQVFVDGSKVADVSVNHHLVNVERGMHNLVIYPVNEIRDTDTSLGIELNVKEFVGGSINIDLASLGLDPKRLAAGTPSESLSFDYLPSQIIRGTPDDLSAWTDSDNRVILSFMDQYNADEYLLMVKHGNNTNYLTFRKNDENARELISQSNSKISLILDPTFLTMQECMIPELNEEYVFSVQLRKYGLSLMDGISPSGIINESKVSGELKYKVTAAWKEAPVITFSSQIADGKISLKWDHNDYGAGCEYLIMKINKVLGVMTGEEEVGRTTEHEITLNDLQNGNYCFNIVPIVGQEKGVYSGDANIEIKNEWVLAPVLSCEQIDDNQIKLKWNAASNIEKYHVVVSKGNSASLLSFVDLDFQKYTEFDVAAEKEEIEYIYLYDGPKEAEGKTKLKFDIYGIHKTTNGETLNSSTSTVTITID